MTDPHPPALTAEMADTAALVALCREDHPDPAAVRLCVVHYADLEATCPLSGVHLVERLVVLGSAELARACCATLAPESWKRCLDCLCLRRDTSEAVDLLREVLGECEQHGWKPTEIARAVLKTAAACGVLSNVYPAVRETLAQAHAKKNDITIVACWVYDWAHLLRKCGQSVKDYINCSYPARDHDNAATAALYSTVCAAPMVSASGCGPPLGAGGLRCPAGEPRRQYLVRVPLAAAAPSLVASCSVPLWRVSLLCSRQRLRYNWMWLHGTGKALLSYLVERRNLCTAEAEQTAGREEAVELLARMIDWWAERHVLDAVDFSTEVVKGWRVNFISLVATKGLLCVFWPVLVNVAYYGDRTSLNPLVLSYGVWTYLKRGEGGGKEMEMKAEGTFFLNMDIVLSPAHAECSPVQHASSLQIEDVLTTAYISFLAVSTRLISLSARFTISSASLHRSDDDDDTEERADNQKRSIKTNKQTKNNNNNNNKKNPNELIASAGTTQRSGGRAFRSTNIKINK
eukprot:gene13435-9246_t